MKRLFTICLAVLFIQAYGQQYPDRHNTTLENTWLSNATAMSPNPNRGMGHWLMYDLGTTYALHQSTFWNVNAYGYTDDGAKDILIDYSLDGINWKAWGRHSLEKAEARSTYEGEPGPAFNGLVARYILITIVTNHGGSNYGLSEFRVHSTPVTISSTEEEIAGLQITAHPNPFSDYIEIKLSDSFDSRDAYYQLIDAAGRIVMQNEVRNVSFQISGQSLSPGMYTLVIGNGQGIKSTIINHIR